MTAPVLGESLGVIGVSLLFAMVAGGWSAAPSRVTPRTDNDVAS